MAIRNNVQIDSRLVGNNAVCPSDRAIARNYHLCFNVSIFLGIYSYHNEKSYIFAPGGMAEWSNAAVLKTVVPKGTGGSNPSSSAVASRSKIHVTKAGCLLKC